MKHWYQSKTIWLAILQAITGTVIAFATQYPEIGFLFLGKSVLDTIVRWFTETKME